MIKKFFGHLKTVARHRRLVRKFCFKCGLYGQGLRHDLSKFSPTEFWAGVKYYTGKCSPNDLERAEFGYSAAWLHHKGRNKHHWEYWHDYIDKNKKGVGLAPIEMPLRYAAEMCCDRIAACRVYNGKAYKQSDAYDYFIKSAIAPKQMHCKTAEKLREWLALVRDEGEDKAFAEIKRQLKGNRSRL